MSPGILQGKMIIHTTFKLIGTHALISTYLGDNCIQIFHLGRCIVGCTVGNLVLQQPSQAQYIKPDGRIH